MADLMDDDSLPLLERQKREKHHRRSLVRSSTHCLLAISLPAVSSSVVESRLEALISVCGEHDTSQILVSE